MHGSSGRVLFCGYDFHQKVYRGIAYYTQMAIEATAALGYDNYILTCAPRRRLSFVQELAIVRALEEPSGSSQWRTGLRYLKGLLWPGAVAPLERALPIEAGGRLGYLQAVRGYVNRPDIYQQIGLHSRLFDQPYPLAPGRFDLVYSTCPLSMALRGRAALVQTIHDIIPLLRTDTPPDDDPTIFYRRIQNTLERSDLVITVSDFTRNEVLRFFPGYDKKLVTVHNPVPVFAVQEALANEESVRQGILRKYRLKSGGFFLFVGGLEKRKNLARLIDAHLATYDRLRLPLVLVGAPGYGSEEFLKFVDGKSVRHLGYLSTLDKLVLLKNAVALLFPSLYEGFGLPPVEAMQVGCPVLTSDASAMPEVCADGALYVRPTSVSSISEGIVALAEDESLRQKLALRGRQVAERFSFGRYCQRLAAALASI